MFAYYLEYIYFLSSYNHMGNKHISQNLKYPYFGSFDNHLYKMVFFHLLFNSNSIINTLIDSRITDRPYEYDIFYY